MLPGEGDQRQVLTKQNLEDAFVGAVTVSERGQVVIPAEARDALGIRGGDKLLVFVAPHGHMVALTKLSSLEDAAREIQQVIDQVTRES